VLARRPSRSSLTHRSALATSELDAASAADGVRDVRLRAARSAAPKSIRSARDGGRGVLERFRSCRLLEGADQYRDMDALGEATLRGDRRAELLGEAGLPDGIRHPAAHC
jgi:hypothetical protein